MAMLKFDMEDLVGQLRCSNCNKYLICPPIVQLKDGNSVCGNCTPAFPPLNPDGSLRRQTVLEKILYKLAFPCKYKAQGCLEKLFFGVEMHREEKCVFRPINCPTGKCPWSGTMFNIQKHFIETHTAMLQNKIDFKLEVDEDSEGTILAVIDRVPFIATYTYDGDRTELYFHAKCLTLDTSSYKIWLYNDSDKDYTVSLEREPCFPYVSCLKCDITLNLDKYMEVLDKPKFVRVNVQIFVDIGDEEEAN